VAQHPIDDSGELAARVGELVDRALPNALNGGGDFFGMPCGRELFAAMQEILDLGHELRMSVDQLPGHEIDEAVLEVAAVVFFTIRIVVDDVVDELEADAERDADLAAFLDESRVRAAALLAAQARGDLAAPSEQARRLELGDFPEAF